MVGIKELHAENDRRPSADFVRLIEQPRFASNCKLYLYPMINPDPKTVNWLSDRLFAPSTSSQQTEMEHTIIERVGFLTSFGLYNLHVLQRRLAGSGFFDRTVVSMVSAISHEIEAFVCGVPGGSVLRLKDLPIFLH